MRDRPDGIGPLAGLRGVERGNAGRTVACPAETASPSGAEWTGIRNFSAQNHLRAMKKGELAFFSHAGKERAIVGIVK
jgi:hypothetical protein